MVDTTLMPPRRSEAGIGDLVLRVCGSSRHGQVVRLRSSKCTIGSGPRCTLRLRARGVGPIHCLILRGSGGAIVRRWSPDTRLNGRAFTDSDLSPGDRLTVGTVELEVVQPGGSSGPCAGKHDEPDADGDALREAFQAERGRWEAERAELERQLAQQAEKLNAQRSELEAEQRALEEARLRLAALQTEPDSASASPGDDQLDARLAELDLRREAMEEERRQWEAERAEFERQLAQQAEELNAQRSELEAEQRAAAANRSAEPVEHRSEPQIEGDPPGGRPAEAQAPHEPADADLQAPDGAPPTAGSDVESRPPSGDAPVDLETVLRRMGNVDLLGDGQPQEAAAADPELEGDSESTEESTDGQGSVERAGSLPPEHDDQESIDDYMARLMERVQAGTGQGGAKQSPTHSEGCDAALACPSTQAAGDGDPSAAESSAASPRRGAAELAPRAVAPEKLGGLEAMRELANLSAHSAIGRHTRRQVIRSRRAKLAVTGVSLAVGAGLGWMWWAHGAGEVTLYSALASLLVALFWGIQYAVLTGRLALSRSGHLDWNPRRRPAENADAADAAAEAPVDPEPPCGADDPAEDRESEPLTAVD